ncbi:hypothetical protein [Streptomyces sp. NPDC127108]|uniref:terpene synthase family protein n=1 Tax=Streptomyces sp. NPDC127108 TaxID=3345361 RepID=UPI00362AFDB0
MDDRTGSGARLEAPEFHPLGPPRLNPHVARARVHCRAWAADMGMLRPGPRGSAERDGAERDGDGRDGDGAHRAPAEGVTLWDERVFDAADYALLAALAHPDASAPQLDLLADWYVWRYFHADRFAADFLLGRNTGGARAYAAGLRDVVTAAGGEGGAAPAHEAAAADDPVERGLADLWSRTVAGHGEAWRARLAESVTGLLEGALWELRVLDTGQVPNPIDYVATRRGAGGGPWAARLVEHVTAFELPGRIVGTRPLCVAEDTFADATGLRADIVAFLDGRRAAERLSNGVEVARHFLKCEPQRALDTANNQLTSRLRQFEHTTRTELPPLFGEYALVLGERTSVLRHTSGLRDWQAGFHAWLTRQPDAAPGAVAGGAARPGERPPGGPAGLGAAAARWAAALVDSRTPPPAGPASAAGPPPDLPVFHVPFESGAPNPYLDDVRDHVKEWARDMGMMRPRRGAVPELFGHYALYDEASFAAADFAAPSAYEFPTASRPRLAIVSDCAVWGTYVGDYIDERFKNRKDPFGAKVFVDRLKSFMPASGEGMPIPVTPPERGLADIWRRLLAELSDAQRHRWRRSLTRFLDGLLWQAANTIQGRVPDPTDYLEMRRGSSGLIVHIDKTEFCLGREVPADLWGVEPLATLGDIVCDVLFVNNDAASYAKEVVAEGAVNNIVTVVQHFMGWSDPVAAAEVAGHLADSRVRQFQTLADGPLTELFDERGTDEDSRGVVAEFVLGLKQVMAGLQRWVDESGRYATTTESRRAHPDIASAPGAAAVAPR